MNISRFTIASLLACWPLAALAEGIPVTVQPLSAIAVDERHSAPGEVVAANRSVVAAQLNARIEVVHADVGMMVKKGDLLVELEPRDFELALAQSDANIAALDAQIEQAEAQLARAESLIEKNFTSREDVQARATSLAVLRGSRQVERVARDIARTNLARTRIVAPFDGEVVERAAQLGGFAAPGAALLTLAQTSGREINVQAWPGAVAGLQSAAPIFTSYNRDYPLRVARVSSVIDSTTQLQTVRLTFADEPAPVGATGTVSWRNAGGLLPANLVERRGGELGVFVARDGVAKFVLLPQAAEGRAAQTALSPDTLVIVDGRTRLQDGDPVSPQSP